VDRAAERNAFSELFAYSNYVAGIFALSGHKDITNILVSTMDVKITRQAYLYDLLIALTMQGDERACQSRIGPAQQVQTP